MFRKNNCDITQTIYICNCNLNIVFFFYKINSVDKNPSNIQHTKENRM